MKEALEKNSHVKCRYFFIDNIVDSDKIQVDEAKLTIHLPTVRYENQSRQFSSFFPYLLVLFQSQGRLEDYLRHSSAIEGMEHDTEGVGQDV